MGVAVSGGADSVALLRMLLELRGELGIVLAVLHLNHKLRGEESDADQAFAAELATQHGLDFLPGHADVREHAKAAKLSLEAAARQLRYEWFTTVAREQRLDAITTAHTLDDQAETVLLKLLRGAGTRGLAGIYPVVHGASDFRIVRPLLCATRADVESYLVSIGQGWREDETNLDRRFLRNRVRHELLPLLERDYNPNIRRVLSDLSEVSRAEEEFWSHKIEGAPGLEPSSSGQLNVAEFAQLHLALQRRLLKRFAEQNGLALDFDDIERLRRCALGECRKLELLGGRVAEVTATELRLFTPKPAASVQPYCYVLSIPGEVHLAELGKRLRAEIVPRQFAAEARPGELLSLDLIGAELTVRNWSPGDRFQPAHSRSEEKLKRLFAEQRLPAADRPSWPVAMCGSEIVWVIGFPVGNAYRWKGDGDAVRIDLIPA